MNRNDESSFNCHALQEHQITQAGSGSFTYAYDANGNATSRNGTSQVWWSFNYPRTLATSSETAEFYYGPDRQKWKQTYANASTTETTYYFDNLVEQVNAGSVTDWRHYIYAGGNLVAVYSRDGTNNTLRYTLSDHQGSVSAITTSAGATYADESFTAYGKRRDASDWSGDLTGAEWNTLNAVSRTGYTGHSQIGTMNLNHMNGRVQDAVTRVFLSADPYVTDPGLTQNYHRYGYVYNNPLSFTDPSGFGVIQIGYGCGPGLIVLEDGSCEVVVSGSQDPQSPSVPDPIPDLQPNVCLTPDGGYVLTFSPCGDSNPATNAGGGNGAGTSIASDTDDSQSKCDVPLPDGSTVRQNVRKTQEILDRLTDDPFLADVAAITVTAWLVSQVNNGGPWDYKLQPGGTEYMGNFNFGAVASAVYSGGLVARAAGAKQMYDHFMKDPARHPYDPKWGTPIGKLPRVGDPPQDTSAILAGVGKCR